MAPKRRKVSVSAQWARRNAAARDKGYASYYDYRAHNYGKTPAGAPRARGEQLARLRGHRGRTDLLAGAGDGSVINISGSSDRDSRGRFKWVDVTVIDPDGNTRTYRIRGGDTQRDRLAALLDQLDDQGAIVTIVYPAELRPS